MTKARHDNVRAASVVLAAVAAVACGLAVSQEQPDPDTPRANVAVAQGADPSWSVPEPGSLAGKPLHADVLVVARQSIPSRLRTGIEALEGVRQSELLSVATAPLGERAITLAAVDPASFRQFTAPATAESDAVWQSVAAGELALTHDLARSVRRPLGGQLALRAGAREVALRIGAHAAMTPRIDGVVNYRRGQQLGMTPDNALLLSLRDDDRDARAIERLVGKRATVIRLAGTVPAAGSTQPAYLTGGAVANAVGSFSYRYFSDGSVEPDPKWVAANMRTEEVPILGAVTCHRVMLPQLRSALAEIQAEGLEDTINRGDYGGCFAPRFIGRDAGNGLSLHTWGIAIDLNVSQNQRGTPGALDPAVVRIFKRWGFAWGGDWSWTDPMHFELAALVR